MTTTTDPEAIAVEARRQSAAVRAAAGRLRSSLEIIEARAAVLTSAERRRLLARACAVILDAFTVREAAERTISPQAPAIWMMLIRQETESIMNAAALAIRKVSGATAAYAELFDRPVALAMAITEDLASMGATAKPKANTAALRGAAAKQAFDRARDGIKPKHVTMYGVAALKTKSADGRPLVRVILSANQEDLEGDIMELSALRDMAKGYENKIAFVNHSYKIPQDVFGLIQSPTLRERGGVTFLDATIAVETQNPVAMQTYAMIQNGTKLGVSVGVIVQAATRRVDSDGRAIQGFSITHVLPLEASIVGIAALPSASTRSKS